MLNFANISEPAYQGQLAVRWKMNCIAYIQARRIQSQRAVQGAVYIKSYQGHETMVRPS